MQFVLVWLTNARHYHGEMLEVAGARCLCGVSLSWLWILGALLSSALKCSGSRHVWIDVNSSNWGHSAFLLLRFTCTLLL